MVSVPYIGDGDLLIDLYDSTPRGPGSEPIMTDQFRITPEALREFARTDNTFGDGYTILFPWFHNRREVRKFTFQRGTGRLRRPRRRKKPLAGRRPALL